MSLDGDFHLPEIFIHSMGCIVIERYYQIKFSATIETLCISSSNTDLLATHNCKTFKMQVESLRAFFF